MEITLKNVKISDLVFKYTDSEVSGVLGLGKTAEENCQMIYTKCNREKSNK